MIENFPKLKSFERKVKDELDLPNYVTNADLKNSTGVTWDFPKKTDLANLKSGVDKLDIDRFKNLPSNLKKLKMKLDQ